MANEMNASILLLEVRTELRANLALTTLAVVGCDVFAVIVAFAVVGRRWRRQAHVMIR